MPWAKIDDRFYLNPKVMRAGLEGRALYIAGLVHAAGGLTDGIIAQDVITRLAVLADVTDVTGATERLVALNLWEETEGGYLIHDYLEYNPTREHMQQVRQVRADAGRLGGRPPKHVASDDEKQTKSNLLPHARVPSRPLPPEVPTATRAVGAPAEPDAEPAPVAAPKRRGKTTGRGRDWIIRDPLYPPLVALFGRPSNREASSWGMHLTSLTEKEATPEEVPRRAAHFPLVMPDRNGKPCTMTLAALDKHWHLCATVPTTDQNGGHDAIMARQREADRRRAQERDEAAAERYRAQLADIVIPPRGPP